MSSSNDDNPILIVDGLTAYYRTSVAPVRAVEDINLEVKMGEIFGVAGESGCGKSTLALAILRLLKPPGYIVKGRSLFKGIDLQAMSAQDLRNIRWKRFSFIPQSSMNALNPIADVEDQIADAIRVHEGKSVDRNEAKKRIERLLVSVGLSPEVANMYPHELSGGMRQRAIIAMAIALNPELIVADEPTTALDVVVQRGVVQLLVGIKRKLNSSIILVTHDMAVQAEVSNRTAIMYAGYIVEMGRTRDVFKEPLHPYTQALISAVPVIGAKKRLRTLPGLPPDLRYPPPGCRFNPRCPRAMKDLCDVTEPELVEVTSDRCVACHLYGNS